MPLALDTALAAVPRGVGTVVRAPAGPIAARPGPAPDGARVFATPLDLAGSPGWSVEAWAAVPRTPRSAWAWALALLALGGSVAEGVSRALRRARADAARQSRLESRQALVTELARVVQSSLDLGEVAPAVAAHLAGRLDLAGLTLSMPRPSDHAPAGERPEFAWGAPADPAAVPPVRRRTGWRRGTPAP